MKQVLFLWILFFCLFHSNQLFSQYEPLTEKQRKIYREERRERERKRQKREFFLRDEEIEERVRSALLLSPGVFDAFLKIKVIDQIVYLQGRFLSEEEKRAALKAIYQVEGVLTIKETTIIKPLTDQDKGELERLRVITGVIPALKTKSEKPAVLEPPPPSPAEQVAEQMRLQQEEEHEDQRIKKEVQFAVQMAIDLTQVQGIYIAVNKGKVMLTGVVTDSLVSQRAARAASGVKGVKSVINQIQIR